VENGCLYAKEVNPLAMNFYKLEKSIPEPAKRFIRFLINRMPIRVEIRRSRPKWLGEDDRISYQKRYINFDIKPGESVLDIGSGAYPFPYATVLVDRFIEETEHRHEPLRKDNKIFVQADVSELPFADKSFDFVYCSHVLEHVEDPIKACREIIRVGKRGYIETPTFGKDVLFAWAKNMHKWHVVAIGRNLCFFEYSQRQEEGIRSSAWYDIIFRRCYHPLQEAFYKNQDIFNVMFNWSGQFAVFVFRLDGSVETLNAEVR
jgi:SAM-dependent methyltransferase